MRMRLLSLLGATTGFALLLGAAALGGWADDHDHVWLSHGCVVAMSLGIVGVTACVLRAVLPYSWWQRLSRTSHGASGVRSRPQQRKLPDDWRR